MIRFKPEVRIGYLTDAVGAMLRVASVWSLAHELDVIVNSIQDLAPGRVASSLHPFGLAIDVEPDGNLREARESLAAYFRVQLPDGYDVVFESSHVHVEYDLHRPPLHQIAG